LGNNDKGIHMFNTDDFFVIICSPPLLGFGRMTVKKKEENNNTKAKSNMGVAETGWFLKSINR
jgi:hypothetical protein